MSVKLMDELQCSICSDAYTIGGQKVRGRIRVRARRCCHFICAAHPPPPPPPSVTPVASLGRQGPVTLTCGHTYCRTCIRNTRASATQLKCPSCREVSRGKLARNRALESVLRAAGAVEIPTSALTGDEHESDAEVPAGASLPTHDPGHEFLQHMMFSILGAMSGSGPMGLGIVMGPHGPMLVPGGRDEGAGSHCRHCRGCPGQCACDFGCATTSRTRCRPGPSGSVISRTDSYAVEMRRKGYQHCGCVFFPLRRSAVGATRTLTRPRPPPPFFPLT